MASEDVVTNGPRVSETTPLLRDGAATENGDATLPDRDREVLQERTLKELLLQLGCVWVGVFFAALDGTVVATISRPISSHFNSLSLLSWLTASYLISNAACQPLSGKLTDIFGRRAGLVLCNVFFGAGNLICGLAAEKWVIILGRTVAGMGGGGLTAISTFLASDLVPLRKRGLWQGIGNICFGLGSALGGVFGGWMNDTWGWRWAFLLQMPFIVVSTALVILYVNVPVKETDTSRWKRIDFLGAFTLVMTLVLFLLGLSTGGEHFPWSHPVVITALALSGVFLLLFIFVEEKIASEPVIPVRLLLDRTVLSACLTNWFGTMSVFAVLIYMPVYLQNQGHSATMAGTRLIAQAVGVSLGSLGLGILMRATGRYLYFTYACTLLIVAGIGYACTFSLSTPALPPFVSLFVYGIGYGGMLTTTLVALIAAVDHEQQAVVTSASYAFRSTGSSIGVTVAAAVFQNLLKTPSTPGPADPVLGGPVATPETNMYAVRGVFIVSFALAVFAFLSTLAMKEHKLHTTLARK
ncbi:hypothetical protein VTO42DRAFT_1532 [Malbranchea cinnamomea]